MSTAIANQIFLAYMGRPADVQWQSMTSNLVGDAAPSAALREAFWGVAVAEGVYQSHSATYSYSSLVNDIFLNLYGHGATTFEQTAWGNLIADGTIAEADAPWVLFSSYMGATNVPDSYKLPCQSKLVAMQAYTDALNANADANLAVSNDGDASVAARTWLSAVTDQATAATAIATVTADVADLESLANAGQTFTLTTGVDQGTAFTGGTGNDTYYAEHNATAGANTLSTLDSLDGGAGTDTLSITSDNGTTVYTLPSATLANIENITIRGSDDVTANVSGANVTGLESITVSQSVDATVTAATTTDISVSGATGAIVVNGGADTTVTAATATQAVTIGGTTVGAGAVSVTHSNQTTGAIAIDGGTAVTVTASKATTGTVKIGDTTAGAVAADMPSGAVSLTTTGAAYAAADVAATRGQIDIVGGSTVTVNQTATSSDAAAAADTTTIGQEITQSAVNVTGNSATTAVTVNQSAAVTAVDGVAAIAGAYETQKVTFVAMAATETIVVNGLTFTASKTLTAAEAAAAFANLANGATQGSAPAGNGVYSGTFSTIGGTTGAVTTASGVSTVTFTSASMANVAALTVSDTAAAGNVSVADVTAGSAATTAVTGVLGIVGGAVTIEGNITGTDVLASATLSGYGAGSSLDSDSLTTLSLANSAKDFDVDNTAATTLGLTVNNLTTGSSLDIGSTYTTLNVTATGTNSDVTLVAGGVQTLTVAGDKSVDLTGATLTALKTVTVTGSAGLTVDASGANVTAVDTAGTTGTVTATVDGTKATYTGGAGVDNVTLSAVAPSKAISLGGGNDMLTLASGTTSSTGTLSGGDGTDTLVMAAADAATASGATTFETKIDGFEKLSVGSVAGAATLTVDMANMDDISYVISANATGAVANSTETALVTFQALTAGQSVTAAGRVVTVATGASATAAQIEAVMVSGVSAGDLVVSGALASWTAADNGTVGDGIVTFTSTTANTNVADITVTDAGLTQPTAVAVGTPTQGSTGLNDESTAWTMQGLTNGQSFTISGLTVTANKTLTATEVAAAFTAGVTSAGNYTVTGTLANPATWTGAAFSDNGAGVLTLTDVAGDANVTDYTTAPTLNAAGASPTDPTVVTTDGVAAVAAGSLTLDNVANNGTLELTAAGAGVTVTMDDATGTADSFNIVTKVNAADLDFGTVAVADVETLNITATDTTPVNTTTGAATISKATLTVTDTAVKSITVTGESDLALTAAGSSLTTVNASALTGDFTFSSAVNSAVVTGGAGDDTLTGSGNSQTLSGGAGADTLIVTGDLATLTGGAGNDVFNVGNATTNVNSYATITDLAAGDVIKFTAAAADFVAAAVTLGDTAVFQDLANAAIVNSSATDLAWFQYSGNTYVIENVSGHATAFQNNSDIIVKITGLVDLSTASFSSSADTLAIM